MLRKLFSLMMLCFYYWGVLAQGVSFENSEEITTEHRMPLLRTTSEQIVNFSFNCYESGTYYYKVFEFMATTNEFEAFLDVTNGDGNLSFPYLALLDGNNQVIVCKKYVSDFDDISLVFNQLVPAEKYKIVVANHNSDKYVGAFELTIKDYITNDQKEGAQEVPHYYYWSSKKTINSTSNGTPDFDRTSCTDSGPNFNKWYQFKATSSYIRIVPTAAENSNFKYAYITLYNSSFKELKCEVLLDEDASENGFQFSKLEVDSTYYFSVDHNYNYDYVGKFNMVITNNPEGYSSYLQGVVTNNNQTAVADETVSLKSNREFYLAKTDENGFFTVKNISKSSTNLKISFKRSNNNYQVKAYLYDESGKLVRTGSKKEEALVLDTVLNQTPIKVFNVEDFQLELTENKDAVLGRLMKSVNPFVYQSGVRVMLLDTQLNSVKSTLTNEIGQFVFDNLSPEEHYLIKVDEKMLDFNLEIVRVNDQAQIIEVGETTALNAQGVFSFRKLPTISYTLQLLDENSGEQINSLTLKSIKFSSGSSVLTTQNSDELNDLADFMKSNSMRQLVITGYTDNVGNAEVNKKLSLQRANSVKQYLIAKGVAESRITIIGRGPDNPVASNDSEIGRTLNRRVEIELK